ncbi:hypothetical protein E2C01_042780 [Portunus trituberculatus]|uniref:Uncharacterized protein n=1 Tax=Portunus trituberculatus TaxID=210409 RepID=A0A5B7FVK0_PORTR|nr:hypothetical protein [Portunus trituberculatus]
MPLIPLISSKSYEELSERLRSEMDPLTNSGTTIQLSDKENEAKQWHKPILFNNGTRVWYSSKQGSMQKVSTCHDYKDDSGSRKIPRIPISSRETCLTLPGN